MAQVKIYGIKTQWQNRREQLSDVIHSCVMDVLHLPAKKRAHRFFLMDQEDMVYPTDRSNNYVILEIALIEGRSMPTKKQLVRQLFDRIETVLGIAPQDVEICLQESPACNWGFRGLHGDEAKLNYSVQI